MFLHKVAQRFIEKVVELLAAVAREVIKRLKDAAIDRQELALARRVGHG